MPSGGSSAGREVGSHQHHFPGSLGHSSEGAICPVAAGELFSLSELLEVRLVLWGQVTCCGLGLSHTRYTYMYIERGIYIYICTYILFLMCNFFKEHYFPLTLTNKLT